MINTIQSEQLLNNLLYYKKFYNDELSKENDINSITFNKLKNKLNQIDAALNALKCVGIDIPTGEVYVCPVSTIKYYYQLDSTEFFNDLFNNK